jgi:hypothetical protein
MDIHRVIDVYMTGLIGTAQQLETANAGSGGSAPTGVEIYSSNGGTIRTCTGECITLGSSSENALEDLLTTDFSSLSATIDLNFNANYTAQLNNNSGALTMEYYAYMTATGATSFEWDVYAFATIADRNSAISSWGATGTAATSQDGTSGLGENATIQHNSGGRGYLLLQPAALGVSADAVSHKIRGLATNSNGTTSTSQLLVTWEVN